MKKALNYLAVIIILLTSCTKNEVSNPNGSGNPSLPPTPSLSVTITPDTIWYAKTAVINWASTNAISVSMTGGNINSTSGSVATSSLFTSTTYSFTATGPGGSVTKQASVHVWSQFLTLLCWDDSLNSYAKWENTKAEKSTDGGISWEESAKDLVKWIYFPDARRQGITPSGTSGMAHYQISYSGGDTYINLGETFNPPNQFKIESLDSTTQILSQIKNGTLFRLTYTKVP